MNGLTKMGIVVALVVVGLYLAMYLTVSEFLLLMFISLTATAVYRMIVEN